MKWIVFTLLLAVPRNVTGHGREESWIVPARHMKMPDYKRKRISLFLYSENKKVDSLNKDLCSTIGRIF